MTKTSRHSAAALENSFHKHYASIWGSERWDETLYPALAAPTRQCVLLNRYVAINASWNASATKGEYEQLSLPLSSHASQVQCLVPKHGAENEGATSALTALPPPQLTTTPSQQRLMTHWNLDAASVLAASLLNVESGEQVLDLCAAPGGKSIALAQNIWPHLHHNDPSGAAKGGRPGHLSSNEHDAARHKRLTENLKAYLPNELFQSKAISIPKVDGADILAYRKLSLGGEGYDKVLVDAPCSSERHIIHAQINVRAGGRIAPEIANWKPTSYKRLVQTQVNLLMTAVRAAKIGGTTLYATCSIEPAENDGVVDRVIATINKEVKKGGRWTVNIGFNGGAGNQSLEQTLEQQWAERTKHGWIVLPDRPSGGKWGPLYFAMLTKVATPQP